MSFVFSFSMDSFVEFVFLVQASSLLKKEMLTWDETPSWFWFSPYRSYCICRTCMIMCITSYKMNTNILSQENLCYVVVSRPVEFLAPDVSLVVGGVSENPWQRDSACGSSQGVPFRLMSLICGFVRSRTNAH